MYKLTQTLPFMLYTITNHVTGAFSAELAEHRLTIAMYRVMAALLEQEDQSLGELSEMIFIEITTLSRLVGAMNRRGLVSRHRSEFRGPGGNLRGARVGHWGGRGRAEQSAIAERPGAAAAGFSTGGHRRVVAREDHAALAGVSS